MPEQGVWTNRVTKVATVTGIYYIKEFRPFQPQGGYDPPRIPAHVRARVSFEAQHLAAMGLAPTVGLVPLPLNHSRTAFIMEGSHEAAPLHRELLRGRVPNDLITALPKVLAGMVTLRPSVRFSRDAREAQRFIRYKLSLQYLRPYDGLDAKAQISLRNAAEDYFDGPLRFTHGDFNSRNILMTQSGRAVIIDFDHAHWGNVLYDIAYVLSEVVVCAFSPLALSSARRAPARLLVGFLRDLALKEDELRSLGPHLAAQMLYRLAGPSASRWSGHLSSAGRSRISSVAESLVRLSNVEQVLDSLTKLDERG